MAIGRGRDEADRIKEVKEKSMVLLSKKGGSKVDDNISLSVQLLSRFYSNRNRRLVLPSCNLYRERRFAE